MIYYIHIIGDHEAGSETTYINMTKMPLARAHAGDNNPDIYSELVKHIGILFRNQRKEAAYQTLLIEINQQAAGARKIAAEKGGINTMEKFNRIHPYAEKLMTTLIQYIPELLKNEPFFVSCFPSVKNQ